MNRRTVMTTGMAAGIAGTIGAPNPAEASAGLYVPPEEDPHELTFMQWPVSREVYGDALFLAVVQQTIIDIANAIADFEPVALLADASHHQKLRGKVSANVTLWNIPTDDLWCRDSGPLIARQNDHQRVVSHIQFNGWGNKQVHTHDGQIAARVAEALGFNIVPSDVTGEAGGLEHDGHGHLIAHESSWVIANRNPDLTRDEIGQRLMAAYGAETMVWSPGIRGWDITDYHIDGLARFTGPGRVLMNLPSEIDLSDPFQRAGVETRDALKSAGFDVEVIPEPNRRRVQSIDFVASYANYYACNNAIFAASFGDPETDAIAQDVLARHYPGREIVTLNVDVLGKIGGGIHCATQQLPAG